MASFRYRAVTLVGDHKSGVLEAASAPDAVIKLRGLGLIPIEATEASPKVRAGAIRLDAAGRQAVANAVGELSVLLAAGLTLDRALAVSAENIRKPALKTAFAELNRKVKEGAPLSRAMTEARGLFPPMASAMAEAGEASGRLDVALARLGETLERNEALRQTIVSALIYPVLLLVVASSVILMMLLVVVPQFQSLFEDVGGKLPLMSRMVMGASSLLRHYGLVALVVLIAAGAITAQWARRPAVRAAIDRAILKTPHLGAAIAEAETARFARVLGSLVDGGVPVPQALAISHRSISNRYMAAAIAEVAASLKEGGALTRSLAATDLFPPMALSFLRTGEETAQLGQMLNRLADVLDRNVRTAVQRFVAILTPAITVVMGAVVATVIASIMSAILGFNDLALAP